MKEFIQARKYAEALYKEVDDKQTVLNELNLASASWQGINQLVPMYVSDTVKEARLSSIGFSKRVQQVILLLAKSGQMRLLPRIHAQFVKAYHADAHIYEATLTTSQPLSYDAREQIQSILETKHNATIQTVELIDANVIGGLKVEVNNHVFDDTIATKIQRIKEQLMYEMENSQ